MRLLCVCLAALILIADRLTKMWAENALDVPKTVIEGFFRLRLVNNEGIAFGLFHSSESAWKPFLLVGAAVLALIIVLYYIRSTPVSERRLFLAFGLLLGGILGNLIDRMMHGSVVDFIELHWRDQFVWPNFNLADAAITCGVAVILFETLFGGPAQKPQPASGKGRGQSASVSALILPLLIASPPSPPATLPSQEEALEAVRQLEAKYEQIQSFSADFLQITSDRGITQEESGLLKMKKPGLMRWEYQAPRRKLFVSDGRMSYFYNIEAKQVIESEIDLSGSDSPLLLLLGEGRLSDDFEPAFETAEPPRSPEKTLLRLTPHRAHSEIDYLLLEFDPETRLIERLSVIDPIGQRNDYVLSAIRENPKIPDKLFRFRMPKGVERIQR